MNSFLLKFFASLVPKILGSTLFLIVFVSLEGFAGEVQLQLSSQGETVHLEFAGKKAWSYQVQKKEKSGKSYFEIIVEPLDAGSIEGAKQFKSSLVSHVEVDPIGKDNKSVVRLYTSKSGLDSFDYLIDQPSRLIVDLFKEDDAGQKEEEVAAHSSQSKLKGSSVSRLVEKPNFEKRKSDGAIVDSTLKARSPAGDNLIVDPQGIHVLPLSLNEAVTRKLGVNDGGDPKYERFSMADYEIKEEAILKSKQNYYIQLPPIGLTTLVGENLRNALTEDDILPKDDLENKNARLLLTLFKKNRYSIFIKTYSWFKQKFPKSEYNSVLDFIVADVYTSLWRQHHFDAEFEKALESYEIAVTSHPDSPLYERVKLLLGFLNLEKNDPHNALRQFNLCIQNPKFQQKRYAKQLAKMGLAESLAKIGQIPDSIKEFEGLAKDSEFPDIKAEAKYRLGDAYNLAAHKTYKPEESKEFNQKSIQSYEAALKEFPGEEKYFPGAYYNRAESAFFLKDYRKSLDLHREYLKRYATNDFSPLSITRVGELLEILGADEQKVLGAFLEAYFRFGDTPNVVLARLRILSKKMIKMQPKEIDTQIGEIQKLVETVNLDNIKQFATIMIADGYSLRGDFQKSNEFLTKYYKANANNIDRSLFGQKIEKNFNGMIKTHVGNGKFIQALKIHRDYLRSWPFATNRLDTKFYLGRAYEMGGAYRESRDYYQDLINNLYSIKGTNTEKEIKATQDTPTDDSVNLRLSAISSKENQFKEAYDYLRQIKNPDKLSESEQIERVRLAVDLLERRGDIDSSVRFLTDLLQSWKGIPALASESYFKLAALEEKRGRKDEALIALNHIDELMNDSKAVPSLIHFKSLEKAADLYLENKNTEKAITSLEKIIERYEDQPGGAAIRYRLGDLYFRDGNIKKASEVWSGLKEKNSVWARLAQEKLKDSEWSSEYKKYLKRIPAMAGNKE